MEGEIILTEHLSKRFGKIIAIRNLDIRVMKGITGLIGPNGSGKTTTINILIGLIKPSSGKAYVFSLDSWKESDKIRRRIGVLHEDQFLPGSFTILRYLQHIARLKRLREVRSEIKWVLSEFQLRDYMERRIASLSAGLRQRVALAQSVLGRPELVILDEPTSNLDPMARMSLLESIRRLNKEESINFLISSHILPELEKVCKDVIIMYNGTAVEQGPYNKLKEKYFQGVYKIISSNNMLLTKELRELKIVEKVDALDDSLLVKVKSGCYNEFINSLYEIIKSKNLKLLLFEPLHPNLEDIFKEAIKGGNYG